MDELWRLVEAARGSDRDDLPRAVEAVWRRAHYSFLALTEDTDEVIAAMDALCDSDIIDEDLLETRFAAHPDIVEAVHADREWFVLTFAREMDADEVLAICVDTLAYAHLELARRMAA